MYNPYNQFGYPMGPQMSQPMAPQMPTNLGTQPQAQTGQQTQTIQTIQQKPLQAVCYFVKSLDDLSNVDILPGVYYLGINENGKELYVRKINSDGNVGVDTYSLTVEKKEKSELQQISDRLYNIEKQLSGLKGNKNDPRTSSSNAPNHN